ncbi:hypothetical protein B0F90DRAFT_79099 [Multifurca ochricompacta]|uniref:Uncharacterized protein n=1 Tax=Multifurca ochricompacta TaxID=376703 RepID=A0AAD4QTZ8_9AGAM|nr:hypothetical protein B0F90DRAFT_79099 [Multifurca ochricompacta]
MATSMDVDRTSLDQPAAMHELPQVQEPSVIHTGIPLSNGTQPREPFREIPVKVHIRRPDRDSWVYVGRAMVSLDATGHTSQVVVRSTSTDKILTVFNENSELQAEKRGNFVVVGSIEGSKVVSWSLNALNTSETLRLLACIELTCYRCRQAVADPRSHHRARRRIDRVIKDDRRKRHRRRQEQETMIDLFSKQDLNAPDGS